MQIVKFEMAISRPAVAMPSQLTSDAPAMVTLLSATGAMAASDWCSSITQPTGYKSLAGDADLSKKVCNGTKLSPHLSNGKGTAWAQDGRYRRSGLMLQVMPMTAKPLPWDSKELAALTDHTASLQNLSNLPANLPLRRFP